VQPGLARAVAADRVDIHAGRDDRGVGFIGGNRRDNVSALHGVAHRIHAHDLQALDTGQISFAVFVHGRDMRINTRTEDNQT
jgi:hypothetical protein